MELDQLGTAEWNTLRSRSKEDILDVIKRVEKKTFPSNEIFQFDQELKKRNTQLIFCARKEEAQAPEEVIAYMVYTRIKRVAFLQKICVREQYRRKGIANWMLNDLCINLQRKGCDNIQLWVDKTREPARKLYSSHGFVQVMSVDDYYSPGRTGLKMVMVLQDG
ncbi:MAG: hypothetical protein M1835_005479 [Candelina submexicana]|nr:MAG: hypothetical protein M1835_005479 [Candelina submexicana]